ncbi:Membrane protein related to metalloendopeptidase [Brucella abortus A13334]|nr:Membrane protein related to metalloendopeptidase [Brucella abortus A13334]KFJ60329.1 hypothetical protein DK59_1494 [Brucella abortus bv. 4 str. 292]
MGAALFAILDGRQQFSVNIAGNQSRAGHLIDAIILLWLCLLLRFGFVRGRLCLMGLVHGGGFFLRFFFSTARRRHRNGNRSCWFRFDFDIWLRGRLFSLFC